MTLQRNIPVKYDAWIEWSSQSILETFPPSRVVCSHAVALAVNSSQVGRFAVECMFSSGEACTRLMCVALLAFLLSVLLMWIQTSPRFFFFYNVSYRWGCELLGLLLKMKYSSNPFLCFNIWCCLMPCDNLVLHNLPGCCRDKWIIHMDRKFTLPTHS